jgi:lipopolysaccharide export system permease protein
VSERMRAPIPLLQRYVLGELLRVFCFVLLCLTVLLVFVGIFQQASESGLGPMQLLRVLPFIVPSLLPFTIPAALLLTVCLVYGRLAGDLEVTAAKAAGISVLSLLWPSFLIGAALSVCCLVLSDQAIPWAVGNIQRTIFAAMEDILIERLRTDRQFGDRQHGLHVVVAEVQGRRLIRPVFSYMHGDSQATMWAEEATLELDFENDQALVHLTNGAIELPNQGRVYISGTKTQEIGWKTADDEFKPRHLPIRLIERELKLAGVERNHENDRAAIEAAFALTTGDFTALTNPRSDSRQRLRENRQLTMRMNTEIHSRYALACSCLFFVLVGSPLAVMKAQARFLTSFLYCFVPITVGYYPIVLGMIAQAKKGHVDPAWAMWVGNALLAIAGCWLLRRAIRH